MNTVYKYGLPLTDDFTIDLPDGAEVLCVQMQHGSPCMWIRVNTKAPVKKRFFRMAGTGHDLLEDELRYIGTFQIEGGTLVFHVFEKTRAHAASGSASATS